jgi:hypothetical protein
LYCIAEEEASNFFPACVTGLANAFLTRSLIVSNDDYSYLAVTFRNLSGLDPDTAEEMVEQDVMTPLTEYFQVSLPLNLLS